MRHFLVGLLLVVVTGFGAYGQNRLVAGGFHSAQVKADGRLYTWGDNFYGQLGLGDSTDRYLPVLVGSSNQWRQVFAGVYTTYAIRANGTLWAWGRGTEGQIGDGNQTNSKIPVQVGFETDWKSVTNFSDHALGLRTNGTLYAWGSNSSGQLGDGTTAPSPAPEQIAGTWKAVAAGEFHSIGIKSDGSLWAWGGNGIGQLGDGTVTQRLTPVRIAGTTTNWDTVVVAASHTFALTTDHKLYAWGEHQGGVLGLGTLVSDVTVPTQVGSAIDWAKISAGESHAVALKSTGLYFVWGINVSGEFGAGNTNSSDVPVNVVNGGTTGFTTIYAGTLHTVGFKATANTLCSAGYNEDGAIGDGAGGVNAPDRTTFVCINGAPLPITLLDFNGQLVSNNAQLKWKTTNEVNTLVFEVERSIADGIYERVGTVSAVNTPGDHEYGLIDYNVTDLKANVAYYRLKQIDIDGRFTYSPVVPVVLGKKALIRLFPNPAKDQVNISVSLAGRDKATWQVRDLGGRTLMQGGLSLSAGTTNIPIDISRLPRGMYMISVQGTVVNQTLQLIKQ